MRDQLIALLAETSAVDLPDTEAAEAFRIAWLGRKGRMKDLMAAFKEAPNEEKRELGKLLNELKGSIEERIESVASQGAGQSGSGSSGEDLTRPAGGRGIGTHHPLSVVRREIIGIFERMGFVVSEGPEIEDDWHVFSGLNFPEEHPARDMQDTFFVQTNPDILLCAPIHRLFKCVKWNNTSLRCG